MNTQTNKSKYFETGTTVWVVNLGEYKGVIDGQKLTIKDRGWNGSEYLYSFEETDTKLIGNYLSDINMNEELPDGTRPDKSKPLTVEEAAINFSGSNYADNNITHYHIKQARKLAFEAGAEWQKEQYAEILQETKGFIESMWDIDDTNSESYSILQKLKTIIQ